MRDFNYDVQSLLEKDDRPLDILFAQSGGLLGVFYVSKLYEVTKVQSVASLQLSSSSYPSIDKTKKLLFVGGYISSQEYIQVYKWSENFGILTLLQTISVANNGCFALDEENSRLALVSGTSVKIYEYSDMGVFTLQNSLTLDGTAAAVTWGGGHLYLTSKYNLLGTNKTLKYEVSLTGVFTSEGGAVNPGVFINYKNGFLYPRDYPTGSSSFYKLYAADMEEYEEVYVEDSVECSDIGSGTDEIAFFKNGSTVLGNGDSTISGGVNTGCCSIPNKLIYTGNKIISYEDTETASVVKTHSHNFTKPRVM